MCGGDRQEADRLVDERGPAVVRLTLLLLLLFLLLHVSSDDSLLVLAANAGSVAPEVNKGFNSRAEARKAPAILCTPIRMSGVCLPCRSGNSVRGPLICALFRCHPT